MQLLRLQDGRILALVALKHFSSTFAISLYYDCKYNLVHINLHETNFKDIKNKMIAYVGSILATEEFPEFSFFKFITYIDGNVHYHVLTFKFITC